MLQLGQIALTADFSQQNPYGPGPGPDPGWDEFILLNFI
jgi:hypothetical protein